MCADRMCACNLFFARSIKNPFFVILIVLDRYFINVWI